MNLPQPLKLLLALICLLGTLVPASHADLANVSLNGTAYASGALWPGDQVAFLNDGDISRQIHSAAAPESPFSYRIDLGNDYTVKQLKIYPRQDGCCPERLRNFHVSIHTDDGGGLGTEVWGADLLTADGENAGSGAGKVVVVDVPGSPVGRWVKVQTLTDPAPDYSLQITEIQVIADVPAADINRALNTLATANGPLYAGLSANALVDGNRNNIAHGDVALPTGFAYTINMGTKIKLNRIRIWARQDGHNGERLSNYRVTVHADDKGAPGAAVWTADLHTDGSNAGAGIGAKDELIADADAAGTFEGQYIRIQSLDDPVNDYSLQIAEVEAFGEPVGGASILVSQDPQDVAGGVGGTVRFSVVGNVVGGDTAALKYQWQRNGVNIPGATSATYQTPPLLLEDDKAKFRCVLSYAGLPDVTSAAATVRLDLAYQAKAYNNRPLWGPGGWNISQLVDGDRNTVIHGDQNLEPGFAYQIDLGTDVNMEEIDIFPRQDGCCPERLKNIRVSVHKDNGGTIGDAVWSSDLYTDSSNAGSGNGKVTKITGDLDATGKFSGQWIEILSLEDPVTPYALQMTEVEVYGTFASGTPVLSIFAQPGNTASVPGRTARFAITAKVVNGNPTKLGYQWTKDGVPIVGANTNSYTTPPLTDADTKAIFRCVISYPGVPDLVSDGAQVSFDYNYAKGQPAFSNRPLWGPGGWNISQLVDGDLTDVLHGDQTIEAGFAYSIDLGQDVTVDHITIYPRQDSCCPERLRNIHVSLHSDNGGQLGDETWGTDQFTEPGTNAGAGAGVVVNLAAQDGFGDFHGRWFRVLALDDPVPSYFLQISEIQVFGVQAPVLISTPKAGGLELQWSAGNLESSTSVDSGWAPVANATSPYLAAPTDARRFYRLKL